MKSRLSNNPINPTVVPVTRLACASVAPVRPARYSVRWPIWQRAMRTPTRSSILLALLTVAVSPDSVIAAPVNTPAGDFEVVIRHFMNHYGTRVYELRPSGLTVSLEDVDDNPRKELCRVSLAIDKAVEWGSFLSDLPMDKLAPEYIGPADDYVQGLTLSVRKPGDTLRTIRAVPGPPDELKTLCRRVNSITPEGCVKWPMYCGPTE